MACLKSYLLFSVLFFSRADMAYALPTSQPAAQSQTMADLSQLSLPNSSLPRPTDLELKHVVLGIGTQNYTCTSNTADFIPTASGAVASLFDIGPLLISNFGPFLENTISPLALTMYGSLCPEDRTAAWLQVVSELSSTDLAALTNIAIGDHFFEDVAGSLVPTWALTPSRVLYPDEAASITFQGRKEDNSSAPDQAFRGLHDEGAVEWLYLTKAASSSSSEVCTVYRVVTAGGMPPKTCEGADTANIEVEYAAQYWFYGCGGL